MNKTWIGSLRIKISKSYQEFFKHDIPETSASEPKEIDTKMNEEPTLHSAIIMMMSSINPPTIAKMYTQRGTPPPTSSLMFLIALVLTWKLVKKNK